MKVLVVDDKRESRYLLEVLLRSASHEVFLAVDGFEALRCLERQTVDLIVSDILMPEMDGFQLCREIKKKDGLKGIPFIFYTSAYTTKKDESFALSLGADRFLLKPTEPGKFLAAIEETASRPGLEGRPAPTGEERYLKEYSERVFSQLEKKMVEFDGANRDLNERLRELDSLHSILNLGEMESTTLEEVLQKSADILPSSLRYAEAAGARVILDGSSYSSSGFVEGDGALRADLLVGGKHRGTVEVRYGVEKPPLDEGPFLAEEQKLLNSVALHLGRFVGRREAEKALQEANDSLEQKVAERTKALSEANLRLREMDRLKSMFLASMSHELRTPLNAIIGFTSIILEGMSGSLTAEQEKQLGLVLNSGNHLLALVNDLIDISKIEAGHITPIYEAFGVAGLAREVTGAFDVIAENKKISLSADLEDSLNLSSDRRRVKQILANLVGNALKFTGGGGSVTIGGASRNGSVLLMVRDTGVGIREEDIKKLFQPFSRINVAETDEIEGTGIGLYISEKIAKLLGGSLGVTSTYGEGSEFTLTLPKTNSPDG